MTTHVKRSTSILLPLRDNPIHHSMDNPTVSRLAADAAVSTVTTLPQITTLTTSIKSKHNWTDLSYDAIERAVHTVKYIFSPQDIGTFSKILGDHVTKHKSGKHFTMLMSTITAASTDMIRVLDRLKKRYTKVKKNDSMRTTLAAVITQRKPELDAVTAKQTEMTQLSFRLQAFMNALFPLDYGKLKSSIRTPNTTITFDSKQNIFRIYNPNTMSETVEPNHRLGTAFQNLNAIQTTLGNIEKTISSQANEFQTLQKLIVSTEEQLATLILANSAMFEYFAKSESDISTATSQVRTTVHQDNNSAPASPQQTRKRKLSAENKFNHLKISTNDVESPPASAISNESDRKRIKMDLDKSSVFENVVKNIAVPEYMALPETIPPAIDLAMPLYQKFQDINLSTTTAMVVEEPHQQLPSLQQPAAELTAKFLACYPTGVTFFYHGRYIMLNKLLINHCVNLGEIGVIGDLVNHLYTDSVQSQHQPVTQDTIMMDIVPNNATASISTH